MSEDSAARPAFPSLPEGGPTSDSHSGQYAPAPPVGPAYAPYAARALPALPPSTGEDGPWPAPPPPPTSTPNHRRMSRWWWAAGSLVFAALVGLSAYLIVVSQQWSNRVDDLTAISESLGAQVADETMARQSAEAEASTLQSQVDTATARITDLANEEANATDHEAVWINLVDAMADCADGRQDLIDVLTNSRLYFPGKTNAQYESEITTYCDGVESDYAEFKTEIGK